MKAKEAIWEAYHRTATPELRDELLVIYLPLVKNVANRMALGFPKSVEVGDLIDTGVVGLIEAFKNYDPERGVKFETYAVPRIRGAILDELRALDWVPRSTRARARDIENAMVRLVGRLGRSPNDEELAKELNYSLVELHKALDDSNCTILLSLDEMIYKEDDNRQIPRVETVQTESKETVLNDLEKQELKAYLTIAISNLTEQEKLVIALYYYEELTLKEIGQVMSISESRVSQIHTKAVMKLRGMVREKFALT